MKLFSSRVRLPEELRRSFEPDERAVSVADTVDSVVVATQLGLWLPATDAGWQRIGWEQIVKATWTDAGLQITPGTVDADGVVDDLAPLLITLTEPHNLPVVVRQRVEASIARWEQIRVPGGTARLIARRLPGRDGYVWTARLDTGTLATGQARAVALANLEQARANSVV